MNKIVLITLLFMSALSVQVRAQASYGDITWGSYNMYTKGTFVYFVYLPNLP